MVNLIMCLVIGAAVVVGLMLYVLFILGVVNEIWRRV